MTRRILLTSLVALLVSCTDYVGPLPDPTTLEQPVGITIHPSGEYVYVVTSNFDGNYRLEEGGTVSILDAETLTIRDTGFVRMGSFGGLVSLMPDNSGDNLFLVAAVRGDRSAVVVSVAEDGSLSCEGAEDALPCRIEGLDRDPYAVSALPDLNTSDAAANSLGFAVASLRGDVSAISLPISNGEPQIDQASVRAVSGVAGGNTLVPVPYGPPHLVHAGRFSNRLLAMTWFWAEEEPGASASEVYLVRKGASGIPTISDFSEVRDMVFSSDGTRLYVSANSPSSILVFDASLTADAQPVFTFQHRIDMDGAPADLELIAEASGDVLYVALPREDEVAIVDPATGDTIRRIEVGGNPFAMAADTENYQRLYVTLFEDNAVAVIDLDPTRSTYRTLLTRVR